MSEYLPSFIVEPVLRQARRFSERIGGEDNPPPPATELASSTRFTLPNVPAVDFQRFYLTRFWNQSPPPSAVEARSLAENTSTTRVVLGDLGTSGEDDLEQPQETTLMSIARNVQLWAAQINNLDVFPSPPLEPVPSTDSMDRGRSHISNEGELEDVTTMTDFPLPDAMHDVPLPSVEEVQRQPRRTDSETSLNPAHELSYRSSFLGQNINGRSQSDPLAAVNTAQMNAITGEGYGENDYGRTRDGSGTLPEDDGMGPLRKRIHAVWAGPGTPQEKSSLVHMLMTERHRQSRPVVANRLLTPVSPSFRAKSPSDASVISQEVIYSLSPVDRQPTYAPVDQDTAQDEADTDAPSADLGCVHYKRNVKMQCATCERWYTCRLCHDEVEDHILPRRDTRHMLCMICNTPQKASDMCKTCNRPAACYYCDICKLWNNDPAKSIYHCEDCGICRLGEGLGKDFFHCKTCAACMSIQAESTHKCIEKSTKCDCPICGEYMFTSSKPVAFMRCGHSIHESCFAEWCNTSYKCPICSKSIANMESQFRRLDRHIEGQPMPEEYRNNRAYIFCNDCNSRSVTRYHWLGLKCAVCDSYNTAQLELLGAESPAIQEQADRAAEMGVGEAGITASQSHTPTEELTSPANGLTMTPIRPTIEEERRAVSRDSRTVDVSNSAENVRSSARRRDSPFHALPHSPSRPVRAVSPVVGSYFGTGQNPSNSAIRRGSYFSVFSTGSTPHNEEGSTTSGSTHQHVSNHQRSPFSYLHHELSTIPGTDTDRPIDDDEQSYARRTSTPAARQGAMALGDDDDLDFWGGRSPRSYDAELEDVVEDDPAADGSDSDEDEDEDYEKMDEDSDDEGDLMDLMGHR